LRYLFEEYEFDTDRRELHRGTDVVAVAPQVFDLLDYLIRHREHVVTKDDLISAIWSGRVVSDAALTTRLNAARCAIGDSGEEQRLIKTLPRKGFRFVGPVLETQETAGAAAAGNPQEPQKPALTLPDKPSIAVLPFTNLSSDPQQDYFADGMVEDIITGLSRSKSLFVIARHSTFTYKGKAVDIKQVGRELGVRYVLEGSVRKVGDRVRIAVQLLDAATGSHLWADRFDSQLDDIFDLQDRVTGGVIAAISPQLERAEIERAQRKPTENLQAYDYYLRAFASFYKFTREAHLEAIRLAQTAREIDPEFAAAYALGARCYVQRKTFGWSIDVAQERDEVRLLARRALELDKDDPSVLATAGYALVHVAGEIEEGAPFLARAVKLDPNLVVARHWSGYVQLWLGNIDAAIGQFEIAMRLNPLDPRMYNSQTGLACAHFLAGRFGEATLWAEAAVGLLPSFVPAHFVLAACHAMSGRIGEARAVCARAVLLDPTVSISSISSWRPYRRPEHVEKWAQAFRIAGMPE
jgi:TolB-like protein/tetratricopeptide (TPR) repeat protein